MTAPTFKRVSARLGKAAHNRLIDRRDAKLGAKIDKTTGKRPAGITPRSRRAQSTLCRCRGCVCTTSMTIPLIITAPLDQKADLTCGSCKRGRHS